MKKTLTAVLSIGLAISMLTGCGGGEKAETAAQTAAQTETAAASEVDDQAAADEVAALIDAIYVQTRTADTDAQCTAAKAGWDALTDAQKELVEGEFADPDYFGRDTGDASADDPRNADGIGENEILTVSFGTSFNDSRSMDIGGVEKALEEAYPGWAVRRAFTAQIIINHVQARDGEIIDNVEQALQRAVDNGVKTLIIQPTHLMHGAEYDELKETADLYADQFEKVVISEPLLGPVGSDTADINDDKQAVAEALTAEAVQTAGYSSLEAAAQDSTAFVFIGHGTSHNAKITYDQMQTQMDELGYENVFIGTVEGEPEDTSCEAVIEKVNKAGYKKVVLRPLMVVAGDHAHNDMAGDDEDSWKSLFEASAFFDQIDCQVEGLGSIEAVQQIYVSHTADAMAAEGLAPAGAKEDAAALEIGSYQAKFTTDSSMFHVNETNEDLGLLTVSEDGMMIHVSLAGTGILNLFPGTAEEAQAEGAQLLEPTLDTVTYADGTSEEVYGFDIPVPAIGEEFDLALVGEKGKWYDHKVMVSDPQPVE